MPSDRLKVLAETGGTVKAAMAIERGTAEAHPRMGKPGAFGKLALTPRETAKVERTFRGSLRKSAKRRGVTAKPSLAQSKLMASGRKPVRRSSRMSGSGR
jgi:hypothetical protein